MGACFESRNKNKKINSNSGYPIIVSPLKASCEIDSHNNNIEVNEPKIEQSLPESFELKTPNIMKKQLNQK